MSFNPKFKEFVEKNPDKGMLGMFWSLYWRFVVLIMGIYFGFIIVIMAMAAALAFFFAKSN